MRLFLALLLMAFNTSVAHSWSEPYATYLFAPGLWSSEHQAAKYCSEYTASTGQKVIASHGFELINGAFSRSCNFAEISLISSNSLMDSKSSWSPPSLFLNKIYTLAQSILTTSNNRHNLSIKGQSTNGLTLNPYILNLLKLNFGQMLDIKIFSQLYDDSCQDATLPEDIVLFGTSRGAATIINFMALEYFKKPQKRVKAIILEGCYDSFANLTSFSYPISLFTAYNYRGIEPITNSIIKAFVYMCNLYGISVLFVTSEKENRIPAANTFAICDALKKAGLDRLYLQVLKNSVHSMYLKDDLDDAQTYEAVVHALYQKYGISHDLMLAFKGKSILEQSKL